MPVTSSEFVYWGGFTVFSSYDPGAVNPATTSEFVYWGGFTVFSSYDPGAVNPATTWFYYGGFHLFSLTESIVATSSGVVATSSGGVVTSSAGSTGSLVPVFMFSGASHTIPEAMFIRARHRSNKYRF